VKLRPSVAGIALAAIVLASKGRADPRSLTGDYSPYEKRAIADAETSLKTSVDPAPEGKTIEEIFFVRLDPFDRHDPLPEAVNAVHATSREEVIRRELVVHEGQPYSKVAVDESARNLRLLSQVSLVICIAMKGSRPDTVKLVVITKDVWSLYVDFNVSVTRGGLELLDLEPKETNVGGYQHKALARFVLQPESYNLGASYEIPRLDGRHLDLFLDGNVIINRASGDAEGTVGSATITAPLWSTKTEWAWTAGITWLDDVNRTYQNAKVKQFEASDGTLVPWLYRERVVTEQAKLTRSYGWENKNDFSIGATLARSEYFVPQGTSDDAQAVDEFTRAKVPLAGNRVEARVFPFAQWHSYSSDFLRTFNLDTLSLQEDARLGHEAWLRIYPVTRALGSTRNVLGAYGGVMYGVAWKDGLARASVESTVESTPDGVSDASIHGQLGLATPSFGIGRLIVTATALDRIENYLNAQSTLGAESLLRGYPTRYFTGRNLVTGNVEYRTRAVSLASIQFGGAAFYDTGDAVDDWKSLNLAHDLGVGLRVVFPQIDRTAFRFDFAVPVSTRPLPSGVDPFQIFFTFTQAVTLPTIGSALAP
jgi:hypothetical protein